MRASNVIIARRGKGGVCSEPRLIARKRNRVKLDSDHHRIRSRSRGRGVVVEGGRAMFVASRRYLGVGVWQRRQTIVLESLMITKASSYDNSNNDSNNANDVETMYTSSNSNNGRKKNVVIVESPAKAKTIENYLGEDFRVLATRGHVRDLVNKEGSVDFDNNFEMKWIASVQNQKYMKEIYEACANA